MIKGIICIDKNGGIGKGNSLLAHLPKDLQHFKEVTSGKSVIMGSKTFYSLPFRLGLPNRTNHVLSNNYSGTVSGEEGEYLDFLSMEELDGVCRYCKGDIQNSDDLFIIGGASIYSQLEHLVEEWIITEIDHVFEEADVFFKPDLTNFEDTLQYKDVSSEEYSATVSVWRKK
jgi:dihydrofolate reductase